MVIQESVKIQVLASNSNGRTNNKLLENAVAIFEVQTPQNSLLSDTVYISKRRVLFCMLTISNKVIQF